MAYRKNEKENINTKTEIERKALPKLEVDYDLYAHLLKNSDASEEEKREYIQTVWSIVMMFVDMGWGICPYQQAQKPCGKLQEKSLKPALTAPDGVKYSHGNLIGEFGGAMAKDKERAGVTSNE